MTANETNDSLTFWSAENLRSILDETIWAERQPLLKATPAGPCSAMWFWKWQMLQVQIMWLGNPDQADHWSVQDSSVYGVVYLHESVSDSWTQTQSLQLVNQYDFTWPTRSLLFSRTCNSAEWLIQPWQNKSLHNMLPDNWTAPADSCIISDHLDGVAVKGCRMWLLE